MHEVKNRADFAAALDRRLSGLQADPFLAQRIVANEEGAKPMAKKISGMMILAVALVLTVTSIAFAATNGFGILNFHPEQAENTAYAAHIVALNQTWEGEAFTAQVHEAVFDGTKLSLTLSIHPKEGADPVYVIPRIRAEADGKTLPTFESSISGGYEADGFWIPCMARWYAATFDEIGIDVLLSEDGGNGQAVQGEVAWTLTFDVLRPEWPIVYTEQDEPMIDEEPWTDAQFEAYAQQFVSAYQNRQILLDQMGMLSSFAAANPSYDESMEEELPYADWSEALLTQEAFTLTDQVVFQFTTKALPVKTAKAPVKFDLPGGPQVTLSDLHVSVSQIDLALRITGASDQPLTLADWNHQALVVLADQADTAFNDTSCGEREDGSLLYTAHYMISGETDVLTLLVVPDSQAREIMQAGIIPDDLREMAIVVELE